MENTKKITFDKVNAFIQVAKPPATLIKAVKMGVYTEQGGGLKLKTYELFKSRLEKTGIR